MSTMVSHGLRRSLAIAAAAIALSACADGGPVGPVPDLGPLAQDLDPIVPIPDPEIDVLFANQPPQREIDLVVAKIRRATDKYHNLNVAKRDGFVLLHECEVRPGEGPVGIVYVHPGRVADGQIRANFPDALVYEPRANGRPRLVAVEMAIPFSLWTKSEPPKFLGATFQPEDEFGVFGLHIWVWRHNPNGLFAEANPRVSCDPAA